MNLPIPPTDPELLAGDATAVGIAGLTWASYLPDVAAALSVLWLLMRVGETIHGWYKAYMKNKETK